MKKTLIFLTFLILFCPIFVDALETGKVTSEKGVKVRIGPSTTYNTIGIGLGKDEKFIIYETVTSTVEEDTCSNKEWYKIMFDGSYGYVCKYFTELVEVVENPDYDYSKELEIFKKYPGYEVLINNIHALHPNWKIYPSVVGLTFEQVVNGEYGKKTIQTSNEGYRSIDDFAYDWSTNTWYNLDSGEWKGANKEVIAYYLDSRNFLNDKNIFMFEGQNYSDLQTEEGVIAIFNGTFLSGTYPVADDTKTYSSTFMEAAKANQISPYLIASRAKQEVVKEGGIASDSVSGTVKDYEELYNFFNINAYERDGNSAIVNGLLYARAKGWTNRYDAIVGGASFIGTSYVKKGQYTLFYQNFNIAPDHIYDIYNNQYMTNVQASYSESFSAYKGYNDVNNLESSIVFYIPVYEDMPIETSLPNKENPNNWLKDLKIDGVSLNGFTGDNSNYTYTLSKLIETINIEALPVTSTSTVTNTGSINITDIDKIELTVKAANQNVRTYTINFNKVETIKLNVEEILSRLKIKYNNNILSGIGIGTSINSFVDSVTRQDNSSNTNITDKDGNIKSNAVFATGDKVNITSNDTKEYNVLIYGDLNGDGEVTLVDLLLVQKILLNKSNLEGVYLNAADVNKDGEMTLVDLLLVQKYLLGKIELEQ